MNRKLRDSRGETLVEMLASILIATLSVAVLFTCVVTANGIGRTAREQDEAYYRFLAAAERQEPGVDEAGAPLPVEIADLKVTGDGPDKTFSVELYGGEGLYSYKGVSP